MLLILGLQGGDDDALHADQPSDTVMFDLQLPVPGYILALPVSQSIDEVLLDLMQPLLLVLQVKSPLVKPIGQPDNYIVGVVTCTTHNQVSNSMLRAEYCCFDFEVQPPYDDDDHDVFSLRDVVISLLMIYDDTLSRPGVSHHFSLIIIHHFTTQNEGCFVHHFLPGLYSLCILHVICTPMDVKIFANQKLLFLHLGFARHLFTKDNISLGYSTTLSTLDVDAI